MYLYFTKNFYLFTIKHKVFFSLFVFLLKTVDCNVHA